MHTLISVLHIVLCLFLIIVVLLQPGKGGDISAAFGGGSTQTVFGSRGATTFLQKLTAYAAITFMLTTITLAWYSNDDAQRGSVINPEALKQLEGETAPVASPAPEAAAPNTALPATVPALEGVAPAGEAAPGTAPAPDGVAPPTDSGAAAPSGPSGSAAPTGPAGAPNTPVIRTAPADSAAAPAVSAGPGSSSAGGLPPAHPPMAPRPVEPGAR